MLWIWRLSEVQEKINKVPGIFSLNTDFKHYFEDNCMKFFEENTLNISNDGKCEDFETGEYEEYKHTENRRCKHDNKH